MKAKRKTILFPILFLFLIAIIIPTLRAAAKSPGSNLPASARSCLVVEEASGSAPDRVQTRVFHEAERPGPGKRLALYADASVEGYVLLAAFNEKDRKLANDFRPQFVKMEAGREYHLPLEPTTWDWAEETEAFEVYVVFLEKRKGGFPKVEK